jgi:zinc-ribbon domain
VELGIEGKEWMTLMPPGKPAMIECPACGEELKAHVSICKSCGYIINKEKHSKQEFVGSEPAPKEKPNKVI